MYRWRSIGDVLATITSHDEMTGFVRGLEEFERVLTPEDQRKVDEQKEQILRKERQAAQ